MKLCLIVLLFFADLVTNLDLAPLLGSKEHLILPLDCGDPFMIAIQDLAKNQPEPICTRLQKMIGDAEQDKICVLIDNIDCVIEHLRVDGIQAFEQLAALASTEPLRDLFLGLRSMDSDVYEKLLQIQNRNLIQYLELIPMICGLFERKTATVRSYNAKYNAGLKQ